MLHFMFYSRTRQKKFVRRLNDLKRQSNQKDDSTLMENLRKENPVACAQAHMLCKISEAHIFSNTRQTYFPLGEDMFATMLEDLKAAERFIYMEYFIIEEGKFRNSILEGEAVWELTKLFLVDFGVNVRKPPAIRAGLYPQQSEVHAAGYMIPFGDGPHPLYERRVGKSVIQNLLGSATRYAWMTSPYLIIDNDLCMDLENAAPRGVDVHITVPHIPDKKMVFAMTQSYYPRLMAAGVKIYEYEPGFST